MKVFLFPGQGSQQKGMGKDLFDDFPDLTQKADKILGYSIKELCLENPGEKLGQTQFTQPAVFVVNALSYLKKIKEEPKPDYVMGHSVAEYNALFASGVVDFVTGLELVKKRGELMALAKSGGMAAVMGLDAEQVEGILKAEGYKNLYVANYNSSFQLVISGSKQEIEDAETAFKKKGAKHYRILNVSGAFHTPYMADAQKKFKRFVKKIKTNSMEIPIISNVTARPYKQEEIKNNMIEQITTPVRWMESIRYLLAMKVDIGNFHEVSGGGLSVVKALALRINHEAGPLDLSKENERKEPVKIENKAQKSILKKKKKQDSIGGISPENLGNRDFIEDYNLKYAYVSGAMYKGIASVDMVVKMARAGFLSFFGTGGLNTSEVENAITGITGQLNNSEPFGMNLISTPLEPGKEEATVDLFLKHSIRNIEAAAFIMITPALVRFRARGLKKDGTGEVTIGNRIMAKVSRPEIGEQFLSPAPGRIIKNLLEAGKISNDEAKLLEVVPMADDLCIEADSGGHTDQGMPYTLMPSMFKLRNRMMEKYKYKKQVRVGAAGGIGTPEAAAAAFMLGADFILTGSINQCTVEAGTSSVVKELLQQIDVQDTDYAPAGDMFELGARVQVLKRGVFFPARAKKLFDIYSHNNSLDELDEKTARQLQDKYFKRSFQDIYSEVKSFYTPEEIQKAEKNPRHKMALIFRWYFAYGTQLALTGDPKRKVDYQVQCGPALGAFNQWVKGTKYENWKNRHVDEIGEMLMEHTATILTQRYNSFLG